MAVMLEELQIQSAQRCARQSLGRHEAIIKLDLVGVQIHLGGIRIGGPDAGEPAHGRTNLL
jgi:hypothetical protein